MTLKDFDKAFLTGAHHCCKNQPRCFPAHIQEEKMLNCLLDEVSLTTCAKDRKPLAGLAWAGRAAVCAMAVLAVATGCKTAPPHATTAPPHAATASPPATAAPTQAAAASPVATGNQSTNATKSLVLQEGDTIKISFPAAPNLDTVEIVRRDGKVTLATIGEYDAAGKTPAAMEADLKKLYSSQLVNSEVSVTVQSSAFVIYVMGAVAKPGKIVSERPLTVLEALIEAGVDNTKSNLKAITVIRTDDAGQTQKTKLNVYKGLHGGQLPAFTLKPYDVINVPERFNFF
jgi:protein involved in polysaccharide export with SLBB domain